MNLLAIDTTGPALSLALDTGGKLQTFHRALVASHDETLIPQIDRLLTRAHIKLQDLNAIAAASGPGRFTGIRIGMTYAVMAASRLKIPAVAITRFEAAAFAADLPRVCIALAGWKNEMYYQIFGRRAGVPAPKAKPAWVVPADWEKMRPMLERQGMPILHKEPDAAALLAPLRHRLKNKRLPAFEPLYLKPAGYEANKNSARPSR